MTNHDMIAKATAPYRGKTLTTEDIGDLVKKMFPSFAEGSNRPNDHAEGNESDCECAGTSTLASFAVLQRVDDPNQLSADTPMNLGAALFLLRSTARRHWALKGRIRDGVQAGTLALTTEGMNEVRKRLTGMARGYSVSSDQVMKAMEVITGKVPKPDLVEFTLIDQGRDPSPAAIVFADERDAATDIEHIINDPALNATTRQVLIQARLGQGKFRTDLERIWGNQCAVAPFRTRAVLRASHILPWRQASNEQRLDPWNGLLLSANLDALFDAGLISFKDDGQMLISPKLLRDEHKLLGIPRALRKEPTPEQAVYLCRHRKAYGYD